MWLLVFGKDKEQLEEEKEEKGGGEKEEGKGKEILFFSFSRRGIHT